MVPAFLKIDTIGPFEDIFEDNQQRPLKKLEVVIKHPWITFFTNDRKGPQSFSLYIIGPCNLSISSYIVQEL